MKKIIIYVGLRHKLWNFFLSFCYGLKTLEVPEVNKQERWYCFVFSYWISWEGKKLTKSLVSKTQVWQLIFYTFLHILKPNVFGGLEVDIFGRHSFFSQFWRRWLQIAQVLPWLQEIRYGYRTSRLLGTRYSIKRYWVERVGITRTSDIALVPRDQV